MQLYCPACGAPIEAQASQCSSCPALFSEPDGWKPVAQPAIPLFRRLKPSFRESTSHLPQATRRWVWPPTSRRFLVMNFSIPWLFLVGLVGGIWVYVPATWTISALGASKVLSENSGGLIALGVCGWLAYSVGSKFAAGTEKTPRNASLGHLLLAAGNIVALCPTAAMVAAMLLLGPDDAHLMLWIVVLVLPFSAVSWIVGTFLAKH